MALAGAAHAQTTVFTHANIIDGTGKPLQANKTLVVKDGSFISIAHTGALPKDATVVDLQGKYIMPAINNAHGHLGIIKDTINSVNNYTTDNIKHQLLRYQQFGVGAVLSLGADQAAIIPLRDSSRAGLVPGATIYSAVYGIGVKNGAPPVAMGMSAVLRPETVEEAVAGVDLLATVHPDVIKIWVDDFFGTSQKMKPEIYTAIIKEAHAKGIRVASHLFYLEDARKLVEAGLDIIAHSIRDEEADDAFVQLMKKHNVVYIPTISLDEFAFSFEKEPEFLNDPTFRAALEPGVYKMVTSEAYRNKVAKDPRTPKEIKALAIAMRNVQKLAKAGILIALGTDSGALPIRPQGFAEHLEMELYVKAGLTPLQAIKTATLNSAIFLQRDKLYGSIATGKKADFIVLNDNPLDNIANTRHIHSVWKEGKKVSDGPL